LELGEKYGVFVKSGGRYEIDGGKHYAKQILSDPERFFTAQVMEALDECAKKEYSYGAVETFDGESD
jgi:hypothetical protein